MEESGFFRMGASKTFGSNSRFPPTSVKRYLFRDLEKPFKGQFHCVDDCKGLAISEAIGTFLGCPVVGKESAGRGSDSAKEIEDRLPSEIYHPVLANWSSRLFSKELIAS